MPFNYDAQLNYMPVDQKTLDKASATPFTIAGKAMTQLNDAIDNRAFERDISSVKDLQGLSGLTPTTDKQQALMASKQGIFNALAQQESRALQNQLAQGQLDMLPYQQDKAESDLLTSQLAQQETKRAFDMKAKATKELSQGGIYTPDKFSLQFGKDGSVVEQGVSPTGFNALSDYERISAERQLDPKGQSATFDLMQEQNELIASSGSKDGGTKPKDIWNKLSAEEASILNLDPSKLYQISGSGETKEIGSGTSLENVNKQNKRAVASTVSKSTRVLQDLSKLQEIFKPEEGFTGRMFESGITGAAASLLVW
jgi:hypothetical protein